MTSDFEQAARAYQRADKAFRERRADLVKHVVKAADEGMPQTDICRITGWTRDYVRKIVKAAHEKAESSGS